MKKVLTIAVLTAVVACVAALVPVPAAQAAAPYDSSLSRYAREGLNASMFETTHVNIKPVYVRCFDSDREFEDAAAWRTGRSYAGVVAYAIPARKTVYMRGRDCGLVNQFVADSKLGRLPGRWQTYAYSTLLHEALHVQGIDDERVTECVANDSVRWAARSFGLDETLANRASRIGWDMSAKYTARSYFTVSGECQSTLRDADWTDFLDL